MTTDIRLAFAHPEDRAVASARMSMAWKGSTALRLEMEINGSLLGLTPDICRKARGITMERLDKAVQKSHSA